MLSVQVAQPGSEWYRDIQLLRDLREEIVVVRHVKGSRSTGFRMVEVGAHGGLGVFEPVLVRFSADIFRPARDVSCAS
jgi:hypothetical protein